jgi:hypothetical protein
MNQCQGVALETPGDTPVSVALGLKFGDLLSPRFSGCLKAPHGHSLRGFLFMLLSEHDRSVSFRRSITVADQVARKRSRPFLLA